MNRRDAIRALAERSRQVVLLAAVVGLLTGVVVAGFERIVVNGFFDRLLRMPLWCIAIAPPVGLVLTAGALRWIGGGASPSTADEYLRAFHDPTYRLGPRAVAGRFVGGVATLGFGGAMGLEGMSTYMGAAIGQWVQRRYRRFFPVGTANLLLVAGAAAGVAAVFKAPATGAVFALEVPYQDDFARRRLLAALVAAASGYLSFVAINGTTPLFAIHGSPALSATDLWGAVLVGVTAGFGARLFARLVLLAKHALLRWGTVTRLAVVAPVLVAAYLIGHALTGEDLVVGAGYHTIAWAVVTNHSAWIVLVILLLRCTATAAAIGGGGVGGLFIPLVVAGALLGRTLAGVVGLDDPTLLVVIGVAAFLGAGYRVPLAGVMFVAEATGRPGFVVPGLLAAVAAELVMGTRSVTEYQVRPAAREMG
ncbi:MAG: chloride channel protein [Acidimicrobiia bacterium]